MVNPINEGGLGLNPATATAMVGHDGYPIGIVYTKLATPRDRTRRAMDTYQQLQQLITAAEAPRLHVVGAR